MIWHHATTNWDLDKLPHSNFLDPPACLITLMHKRPYLGDPEQILFVTAISDCWNNHTHARSQSQDFVVSINLVHCVVQCLAIQPTGWYENLRLEDCSHLQGNDVSLAPAVWSLSWREFCAPENMDVAMNEVDSEQIQTEVQLKKDESPAKLSSSGYELPW
jgi:hypothetical protein